MSVPATLVGSTDHSFARGAGLLVFLASFHGFVCWIGLFLFDTGEPAKRPVRLAGPIALIRPEPRTANTRIA